MSLPFNKRLAALIEQTGNRLCVGIDPHVDRATGFLLKQLRALGIEDFLCRFSENLIESAVHQQVPAIKVQSAFFEMYGEAGYRVLKQVCCSVRSNKQICILDAKRGDISSTMTAYGRSAFDYFEADALTITPYMGWDVVEPLIPWLKDGCGAYVVWITSNESGRFIQELKVEGKGYVAGHLFKEWQALAVRHDILDALGWVLGVTKASGLGEEIRSSLGRSNLLLPGLGPQGGAYNNSVRKLIDRSQSALLPMSRAISGLGDPAATGSLATISSWSQYQQFVDDRIGSALARLR